MRAKSIKSIFSEFWHIVCIELESIYSSLHWESIVENVEKMLNCREPSNGFAEYICPECFEKKKVAFTCKCRFCPSCGKRYVDQWVEKTVDRIFDVTHRHLVFTIAKELREIIFDNREFIKIMMDCASKTAMEVLQSSGSDAIPGILLIVHTFGRNLKFNPHVHMLMTEGGLTSDNKWIDIPFLPYGLLRKKWQYHLLTALSANLPKTRMNARFIDYLFKSQSKGFYVNGESKMNSARHAARYIGRYMARPALAEHKIKEYDGGLVTFWYVDHKTERRVTEKIPVKEFIKRLVDHIPLKGFKMARSYGLYSRRTRSIAIKILQRCKRFIQMTFEFRNNISISLGWRGRLIKSFGIDPLKCPRCKKEMLLWRIWHPDYGDIFDLCRDGPQVKEEKNQDVQNRSLVDRVGHIQLSLFPV
jgi:hypothetical protein